MTDRTRQDQDEIAVIRAQVRHLQVQLDALAPPTTMTAPPPPAGRPSGVDDRRHSAAPVGRRALLGLTAAGVGGAALAVAGTATPALANDPNDVTLGATKTNAGSSYTQVNTTGNVSGAQVLFQSGSDYQASTSVYQAALAGWAGGGASDTGVYGYSSIYHGLGVVGRALAGYGGLLSGSQATVRLEPFPATGPPQQPDKSQPGDLLSQTDGVWLCVDGGAPGTWRKLQGNATAGAFHAMTPVRVYDSRTASTKKPLAGGTERLVNVANQVSPTGSIQTFDVVPSGATAIVANLTVVNTSGRGYLSVTPSGGHATSTINWFGSAQTAANGFTSRITSARTIKAYASETTDFIIDVSGYYL